MSARGSQDLDPAAVAERFDNVEAFPTPATNDDLVVAHMGLVSHIVRETMSRVPAHVSRDDLHSAGLTALVALAAHPADALSRGLVQMAPTATRFVAAEGGWLAAPRRLAATFLAGGAEA